MAKAGLILAIMLGLVISAYAASEDSCVDCHGNLAKLRDLGYPQFFVTNEIVKAQSGMPASCDNCHLGNPLAVTKDDAHKGMLVMQVVKERGGEAVTRSTMRPQDLKDWPKLEAKGGNRATQFLPKLFSDGKFVDNPDYKFIMWHDRNPETFAFNPGIAGKTCGKCHADIVDSFNKSPMGGGKGAHVQSQYRTWTGPTGPQSCGLWVGSLSRPDQDSFTDDNMKLYNLHSTKAINETTFSISQKKCNQCHVGCLDCHYNPGKGQHAFVRKPESMSCFGGGKSFSCHAGPLERRRGDGYFRAEFAQSTPQGKKMLNNSPDIHLVKNVACTDCHGPNKESGLHGDLTRDVNCAKCHSAVDSAHAKGPHKHVDCASCHSGLVGGYAFNFWTTTGPAGKENPLTRIQDYLAEAMNPVIIKNPKSQWIPVHVVPHTSGNVKADEVRLSARLLFRNKPDSEIERRYFSNDSYAITGLAGEVDGRDHDTMVWLNLDRIAHGTGKSRGCESCHASNAQKVRVKFGGGSYKDVEDGEYTIIADGKSLRVTDFKSAGQENPAKGLGPFKDKWVLRGDFSFPAIKDKNLYARLKKQYEAGKFVH